MAQYYSLEEAARVLGISPEELKQKAQSREIRAFMGSGTWQFRTADIDEFARQMGQGSSPDFSLSDMDLPGPDSDVLNLSAFELNPNNPDLAPPTLEHAAFPGASKGGSTAPGDDDDDVVLFDDANADAGSSAGSSRIIGLEPMGHRPSDSDVRVVPESASSSSDSDVKASPAPGAASSSGDLISAQDDDMASSFDSSMEIGAVSQASQPAIPAVPPPAAKKQKPPGSGDTVFAKSPVLDSGDELGTPEGDSDFEYTPSSVLEAFPDSGSDFELPAMDDVSDEFVATPVRSPSDSDVTAGGMGASGINLSKPSDSGINLGALSGFAASPSSSDSMESLELQPLDPSSSAVPKANLGKGPAKQAAVYGTDTDFELDVKSLSGDGEATMQLPADSDFDLSDSDGSSEIISLEDDVDSNAATAMRAAVLEEEEGDSGFTSSSDAEQLAASAFEEDAVSLSKPSAGSSPSPAVGTAVSAGPVLRSAPQQVEWGGLWVGMLSFSVLLTGFLTFIAFDLVSNMYAWKQEGPASGLIKSLAGMFGGG